MTTMFFPCDNVAGNLLFCRLVGECEFKPFITDSAGNAWVVMSTRKYFKRYWGVRAYVFPCRSGPNAVTAAACRMRLREYEGLGKILG